MRSSRNWWLCALCLLLSRSAYAQPAVVTLPAPTLVIVCDGPGGADEITEGLREVIAETGAHVGVYSENWSTGLGSAPDHCVIGNHFRAGFCLAQKVLMWRKYVPHARIVLVGYSTGAHVALLATQWLPCDTVDRVILLAASVSTDYDLRAALRSSREGVDSFFSDQDATLPTSMDHLGTADGKRCPMAGTVGFNGGIGRQLEPQLFCKLRQYGWCPRWERAGHQGDHHGYYHPRFLECFVLPRAAP